MARFGPLLLLVGPVLVLAGVRQPLPVLFMVPVGSRSGGENLTASLLPAVSLALQDLERQTAPLGKYQVQLQLLDSQCDPAKALKALFDALWAGPRYLLMLGGACPSVTSLIARALPALGLLQVSFEAPPPSLSNRKWYQHLFSTAPPVRTVNLATVKLLQRFRWRRVGLLTQDRPGPTEDEDVRIIVGHFEDGSVTEVFCCAFRLGLFGPRYQWILAAGRPSGWRLGWQPSSCSASSLLTAADGSFRLQVRQLSSTNTPGVSGRTPQEYLKSYLKQLNQEGSEVDPLHAFAYDAVWVAARVLVQVKEAAKIRRKFSSLRNASVSEEEEGKMLLEAVKSTQFEGVTGPVSFRNGERMTVIELIQFQGEESRPGSGSGAAPMLSRVLVGEFNTSHQQVRVLNQLLRFKGQDGSSLQLSF
ncbi:gamma-aminobutyric acid type B receptor subunit 2-like isoform X2 [Poecilia latipinna]|uniref:gamma-aminobutyric acid type B receptor subunit 2-like isoform X2 n=1 Tax=Poecilia latipinna TaxID=48699 RepID=UPI00072DFC6A|nr:PREDICTED: gamma-aminobutyric acid type B receptor subunit 2-like isoform X2 [Poecilia latipinna]